MTTQADDTTKVTQNEDDREQKEREHSEQSEEQHGDGVDESSPSSDSADDEPEVDVAELQARLDQEKERLDELNDARLRLQAEFDNYRRRTRREMEDVREQAASHLIEQLLPVVDNLERAIEAASKDEQAAGYIQGTELILKQLLDVLAGVGLEAIQSVGHPFDPQFHEAVVSEPSDEYPEGHIVEELRRGYALKGKVLRVGMVKVSAGTDVEEEKING